MPQYAAFLRNGRADGAAVPAVVAERGGAALVDARDGLAYPALDLALEEAARRARAHGVAFVGVTNSHHAGAMGLVWVLLVAALVTAEKLVAGGEWVARLAGVALLALGMAVAVRPGLALTLRGVGPAM